MSYMRMPPDRSPRRSLRAVLICLCAVSLACSPPATTTKPGKGSESSRQPQPGDSQGGGTGNTGGNAEGTPSGDPGGSTGGNADEPGPGGNTDEPGPGGTPSCINDGDPFAQAAMRARLEFLASPEIGGRVPGTPGDVAVRQHIEERFRCLGLLPGADGGSYQQPFTNAGGQQTANVIGYIPGADPVVGKDIIIVSAHHDHFGTVGNQGLRLGANDDASGVTGMLAVAQYLQQQSIPPRRTVAFVAFGSEEPPFPDPYVEGSARFVSNPPTALPIGRVVYVVNFDMIGTYEQSDEVVYALGSVPGTPAVPILNELRTFSGLDVSVGEAGEEGASDHYPFCLAGIPYVFFWTDDPQCYHRACDTADRINYPELALISKLGGQVVEQLADTTVDLAAFRQSTQVARLGCSE